MDGVNGFVEVEEVGFVEDFQVRCGWQHRRLVVDLRVFPVREGVCRKRNEAGVEDFEGELSMRSMKSLGVSRRREKI